jgi:hypothetical protein
VSTATKSRQQFSAELRELQARRAADSRLAVPLFPLSGTQGKKRLAIENGPSEDVSSRAAFLRDVRLSAQSHFAEDADTHDPVADLDQDDLVAVAEQVSADIRDTEILADSLVQLGASVAEQGEGDNDDGEQDDVEVDDGVGALFHNSETTRNFTVLSTCNN